MIFTTVMIAAQSGTALMATCSSVGSRTNRTDVVDELLYAHCVAKNVSRGKMQETKDRISQACESYELKD